jgi:hypothetical protein
VTRQRPDKLKPEVNTSFRDVVQPRAWLLDGPEASSGNPLRILYVGNQKQKDYVAFLAFGSSRSGTEYQGDHRDAYLGRRDLLTLYGLVRRNAFHCQLIVIEGHFLRRKLYEEAQDYYIPLWLEGDTEIPLVARTKSAKEELRRIRKSKLSYKVTRDPDALSRFYHNMYVPYVQKRHEERAVFLRYGQMIQLAQEGRCELLLVKKGNDAIAGGLNLLGEGLPRRWANGVKDGNLSYWKDGAMAATYYFSSLRLKELGYERMHMGLSRAFLNDGVLQYKRKWGMRVARPFPIGFLIKFKALSPGLQGFLVRNPFVHTVRGELRGAAFVDGAERLSEETVEHMWRLYLLPGVPRVDVQRCTDLGLVRIATLARPEEPASSRTTGVGSMQDGGDPR